MAKRSPKVRNGTPSEPVPPFGASGITQIMVRDFKSLAGEHSIEIRPLTILAGANSSGKSSIMQPLLLMKQTLEASYDPGPLLLDGPNVKFTDSDQFLCKVGGAKSRRTFATGLEFDHLEHVSAVYTRTPKRGLQVIATDYGTKSSTVRLKPDITLSELSGISEAIKVFEVFDRREIKIKREACFLHLLVELYNINSNSMHGDIDISTNLSHSETHIKSVIHLPGLRGNPSRTYPVSAIGPSFAGTFEKYAASVISYWLSTEQSVLLDAISYDLKSMGLTWQVTARKIDETQFELKVGRLPSPRPGAAQALVSIADVGVGVSQMLPVVVALRAAAPGQLVYIEQPEIHLHPRAQSAMAEVVARAALRGVRVVIETHSDLLLLGIRALVAEGKLPAELVKFHWFQRDEEGATQITSADLDENGATGAWPEDFADVQLDAQARYLDAAGTKAKGR